jgi:hypothetical protein
VGRKTYPRRNKSRCGGKGTTRAKHPNEDAEEMMRSRMGSPLIRQPSQEQDINMVRAKNDISVIAQSDGEDVRTRCLSLMLDLWSEIESSGSPSTCRRAWAQVPSPFFTWKSD